MKSMLGLHWIWKLVEGVWQVEVLEKKKKRGGGGLKRNAIGEGRVGG